MLILSCMLKFAFKTTLLIKFFLTMYALLALYLNARPAVNNLIDVATVPKQYKIIKIIMMKKRKLSISNLTY